MSRSEADGAMTVPQRPQFRFRANSASEHDESGTARWVVPTLYRGKWDTETIDVEFKTFMDAHRMNNILGEIWKAGEAAGRAACKAAVLAALEDR